MPGAQMHRSLVCARVAKNAHEYSQRSHRKSPGIPARNGLRLIPRSPEIGRCCLRRRRNVHRLDASLEASGPHGFAVRKLQALSSEAPLASTASRPALVTIAIRPFRWDETVIDMHPISISEKAEYFSLWGWTRLNTPDLARRAGVFVAWTCGRGDAPTHPSRPGEGRDP